MWTCGFRQVVVASVAGCCWDRAEELREPALDKHRVNTRLKVKTNTHLTHQEWDLLWFARLPEVMPNTRVFSYRAHCVDLAV